MDSPVSLLVPCEAVGGKVADSPSGHRVFVDVATQDEGAYECECSEHVWYA